MDTLTDLFALAQQGLFEAVVQPLALLAGQAHILEKAYEATGWLLVGLVQIFVMLVLIGPMQRLWPVEVLTDSAAVRTDVIYTLLHRLGLFKLIMFFSCGGGGGPPGISMPFGQASPISPGSALRFTWCCLILCNMGSTVPSTSPSGGGPCTRCTMPSVR